MTPVVKLLLTLVSAVLLRLAAPPYDLWPLALVGLGPLFLAVRNLTPGRAAALGWLAGLTANLWGLSFGVALLRRFGHLPLGSALGIFVAVCAYQALVWALWAGACRLLARQLALPWLVSAPLCLAVLEALVPFVFPWYLAITVTRAWPLVQVAELGGPPAVSALLVLLNLVLAETALALWRRQAPPRAVRLGAVVVAAVLAAGLVRVAHVGWVRARAPALRVGIVQPNFGIVSLEARKHHGERYVETLRRATRSLAAQGATLVVWPESSFPFLFDRQLTREYAAGHPWELRPGFGGRLLFGALTHRFDESFVYNSAVLAAGDRRIAGTYDKNRLLVFGEYIPFAEELPAWAKRVRQRLPDFPEIHEGGAPLVIADGALRVAPLICYEDLVPAAVHRAARQGPNLLVTLANHAWFGDSTAPRQALALATLRSVETRRDLVRATNTGVSSIGDALGRVPVRGPLLAVPRDEPRPATTLIGEVRLLETFALAPYAAPVFPWACALGLALAAVVEWRRGRRASGRPAATA
ncbi:MAG TPA: apolipoprotein N-acyltransferase [Polyangia bacterium]